MNMKKNSLVWINSIFFLLIAFTGCEKEKEKNLEWTVDYSNVVVGDQHNYTSGHFFMPRTGEVVFVENTADIENSLALMFFTEADGRNTFLTFPAHGETASTWGTTNMRHFTKNPSGVNFWTHSDMVSGMIFRASMTTDEFDLLKSNLTYKEFNKVFMSKNNGNENLTFRSNYILNPESGNVMLLQLNGLVRAIMCVRGVVPSSPTGGSIRFDIIVEGKEKYKNNSNSKYIQPEMP
jgi:hypothetical protein